MFLPFVVGDVVAFRELFFAVAAVQIVFVLGSVVMSYRLRFLRLVLRHIAFHDFNFLCRLKFHTSFKAFLGNIFMRVRSILIN